MREDAPIRGCEDPGPVVTQTSCWYTESLTRDPGPLAAGIRQHDPAERAHASVHEHLPGRIVVLGREAIARDPGSGGHRTAGSTGSACSGPRLHRRSRGVPPRSPSRSRRPRAAASVPYLCRWLPAASSRAATAGRPSQLLTERPGGKSKACSPAGGITSRYTGRIASGRSQGVAGLSSSRTRSLTPWYSLGVGLCSIAVTRRLSPRRDRVAQEPGKAVGLASRAPPRRCGA